ncbi:MAG: DUF6680 family protein [Syntrophales bacterium]
MRIADWLMIVAVLLAPLVAVQVQKLLERYREDKTRKLNVFKILMATRAATVSPQHVQALNMIDLEFQGMKYKGVTDAWKTYLDHLYHYPKDDEKQQPIWGERRVDLLAKLLMEMGKSLGYVFDEVHVKRGIYAPEAHAQFETEERLIRGGLVRLLYGDAHLKMDVTSFPVSEEALKEQKDLREGFKELIDGKRKLEVSVSKAAKDKDEDA